MNIQSAFNKMKIPPEVMSDEHLISSAEATVGDVFRANVIVAVTNERIIAQQKKGRNIDDIYKEKLNHNIPLSEITAVRRTGVATKHNELIMSSQIAEMPPLQYGENEVIDAVIEERNLGKTTWGDDRKVRLLKRVFIGLPALVVALLSGIGFVIGVLLIASFLGILVGLGICISAYVFGRISFRILMWAFNREEEWDVNHPPIPKDDGYIQKLIIGIIAFIDNKRISPAKIIFKIRNIVTNFRAKDAWPIGIFAGSLLWISLFPLSLGNNDGLFTLVLYISWILVPVSIYFDSTEIRNHAEWSPNRWLYIVPAGLPLIASLAGFIWLIRRRKKIGSIFIYGSE